MENNRGFSLVELLAALAVFAIAGIAVFSFMTHSSNHYTRANEEVKLQYEQQLAVNQLRDMILAASRGIYYDSEANSLAIYSQSTNAEGNTVYPITVITYEQEESRLYVAKQTFDSKDAVNIAAVSDKKLLAENVSDFSVDLSKVKKEKVSFTITFLVSGKEQTVTPVIALRNHIQVSDETDSIYTGSGEIVSSFIKSIAIQRAGQTFSQSDKDTIYKSGDLATVKYSALITATDESDKEYAVQWYLGSTNSGISMSSDGAVTIASTVTNNTEFYITATSVDDPDKSATLTIVVKDNGVYPKEASLSLGTKTTGNGFVEYEIIPTITYTNNMVSHDATKLTWKNTDNLPAGCEFTIDQTTGKASFYLTSKANGHVFTILAVTKEYSATGEQLITKELSITIGKNEIPDYQTGTSLKLAVPSDFKRGGTIIPTVSMVNATSADYTYYWTVEAVQPTIETDPFTTWNTTEVIDSSFDNITLKNSNVSNTSRDNGKITCETKASYRSISLECDYNLNWKQPFRLKISVYAVHNADKTVLETQSKYVDILPAKLTLVPQSYVAGSGEQESGTGYFSTESTIQENGIPGSGNDKWRCFTTVFEGLAITDNSTVPGGYNWTHTLIFYDSSEGFVTVPNGWNGYTTAQYPGRRVVEFRLGLSDMAKQSPQPIRMTYQVTLSSQNNKKHPDNWVTSEELMKYDLKYN